MADDVTTDDVTRPFVARIVRTPFVYPDGQIDVPAEIIREPQHVVIEAGWVNVVEYEESDEEEAAPDDARCLPPHPLFPPLRRRRYIRSYPATEIQAVVWVEENPGG